MSRPHEDGVTERTGTGLSGRVYLRHRETGERRSVTVPARAPRERDSAKAAFTTLERQVAGQMRTQLHDERAMAVSSILGSSGISRDDQVIDRPLTKSEIRTLRTIEKGQPLKETRSPGGRSFVGKTQEEAREILRQDMVVRETLGSLDIETQLLVKLDDETMWSGEYGVRALRAAMSNPATAELAQGIIATGATIAAVRGSSRLADEVLSRTDLGSTSELLAEPARLGALVGCANATVSSAFIDPMMRLYDVLDPKDVVGMPQAVLDVGEKMRLDGDARPAVVPIPVNGKITQSQRDVLEDTLVGFSTSLAVRSSDSNSERVSSETFRMQYSGLSDEQLCGLAYEMLENTGAMIESVGEVARQLHASDFQRAMRSVEGMNEEAASVLERSSLNENIRKHVDRDNGDTLLRMLSLAESDIVSNPDKHKQALVTHAASLVATIDSTVLSGAAGAEAQKQALEQTELAKTLVDALSKSDTSRPLALVLVEAQRAAVASARAESAMRDAASQGDDNPIRRHVTDLINTTIIGLSSGSAGLRDQRLKRATEMASAVSDPALAQTAVASVVSLAEAAVKATTDPSIMPAIHHNAAPARRAAAGRDWRTGSKSVESKTLAAMMSEGWEIV